MKRIWLAILLWLSAIGIVFSDAGQIGTTSNNFIKILAPAKPASLGEAYVATGSDINSISYNPAGIAKSLLSEISFTHIEWFQQVRFENLNLSIPFPIGTLGASFNWLTVSPMKKTIVSPSDPSTWEELYNFSPYSMFGNITYATGFTDNLTIGASLKILDYVIDPNDAKTSAVSFLFDFGLIYDIPGVNGLSTGLVFKNVGPKTTFISKPFDQPINIKGGVGYNNGIFNIEVDAEYYNDNPINYFGGAGVTLFEVLSLRAGYKGGTITQWTAGAGLNLGLFNIDYAFVPYPDSLGYTHRATLVAKFGTPEVTLLATPLVFSPNNDRFLDYTNFTWQMRSKSMARKSFITITDALGLHIKEIPLMDLSGTSFWDGKNDFSLGAVPDGMYTAKLTVQYDDKIQSTSTGVTIEVDNTPPTLFVAAAPKEVTPNDYGTLRAPVNFSLSAKDLHGVSQWQVVIRDPLGNIFKKITGVGEPYMANWDGTSDYGKPVKTGTLYTYTFYAADTVGNWGSTKPETVKVLFKEIIINLSSDVLFDIGKADVKISIYNMIKPIADKIKSYNNLQIIVEGHTDNQPVKYSTDFPDNQSLSQARAEATVAFFVDLFHVNKEIFTAVGKGDAEPVSVNDTPEGRKLNRRVTLRIRGSEWE